jgi:hypothetical protein
VSNGEDADAIEAAYLVDRHLLTKLGMRRTQAAVLGAEING